MLFGSFLGITDAQVLTLAVVAVVVVAVLAVVRKPLLFSSVDPDVATARVADGLAAEVARVATASGVAINEDEARRWWR